VRNDVFKQNDDKNITLLLRHITITDIIIITVNNMQNMLYSKL